MKNINSSLYLFLCVLMMIGNAFGGGHPEQRTYEEKAADNAEWKAYMDGREAMRLELDTANAAFSAMILENTERLCALTLTDHHFTTDNYTCTNILFAPREDGDDSLDTNRLVICASTPSGLFNQTIACSEQIAEKIIEEIADESIDKEKAIEEDVADEAITEEQTIEKISTDESITEEDTIEKISTDESITEEDTIEKISTDESITEEDTIEKISTDESITKEESIEKLQDMLLTELLQKGIMEITD